MGGKQSCLETGGGGGGGRGISKGVRGKHGLLIGASQNVLEKRVFRILDYS